MLADGVLQCAAAIKELLAGLGGGFEDETRMGERVIADDVSGLRHRERYIGTLPHVASDHEERRAHVMLRQHFEQLQCMRIVWAIVKGQRDLFAAARAVSKCLSVPLAGRRHRLVPSGRGGGSSGQSDESGEHDRIVMEVKGQRSDCRSENRRVEVSVLNCNLTFDL